MADVDQIVIQSSGRSITDERGGFLFSSHVGFTHARVALAVKPHTHAHTRTRTMAPRDRLAEIKKQVSEGAFV